MGRKVRVGSNGSGVGEGEVKGERGREGSKGESRREGEEGGREGVHPLYAKMEVEEGMEGREACQGGTDSFLWEGWVDWVRERG